jgi:hypothetical protein
MLLVRATSFFSAKLCQCRQARLSKLRQYHYVIIEEPMNNYVIPYETKNRSGQRKSQSTQENSLTNNTGYPSINAIFYEPNKSNRTTIYHLYHRRVSPRMQRIT